MGATEHWVSESAQLVRHPAPRDQTVADLAASMVFFVRTYLHEHGWCAEGPSVHAEVERSPSSGTDGDVLTVEIGLPVR